MRSRAAMGAQNRTEQCEDVVPSALVRRYLMCKALSVVILVCHFILLDKLLEASFIEWGFASLSAIANGRDWTDSHVFPRTILCDVTFYVYANEHKYRVVCLVLLNVYLEKCVASLCVNNDHFSESIWCSSSCCRSWSLLPLPISLIIFSVMSLMFPPHLLFYNCLFREFLLRSDEEDVFYINFSNEGDMMYVLEMVVGELP